MIMERFRKICWQLTLIVVFSIIAAFLWRLIYVNEMPAWQDFVAGAALYDDNQQRIDISLNLAKKFFFEHKALFIDARSYEQYRKGHIKGAINIPWQTVEQSVEYVLENVDPDTIVITYCDGLSCNLSHNLAKFLIQLGYNQVKVLVNGWSSWIEEGLPVETQTP